jgi:pyridinium-3,5-biscarboxylic acid mononucleotide sulfurtransferase
MPHMTDAAEKERALDARLAAMPTAMVAFSAGVDSTYLLFRAHQVLGERVIAVTADSQSLTRASLHEAQDFCRARGIQHRIVYTDELANEAYVVNDGNRCYHCKAALMQAMHGLLQATAREREQFSACALLLGAIAEDASDHRPGMRAARERGAAWPLADVGFTKDDIRARSRFHGLSSWNRPAEPCLSSRIPYGERVTVTSLRMIEQAEIILKQHGFPLCRARHHQNDQNNYYCRIEVPVADIARLQAQLSLIQSALLALGYADIVVDKKGFISGGFNATLPAEILAQNTPAL